MILVELRKWVVAGSVLLGSVLVAGCGSEGQKGTAASAGSPSPAAVPSSPHAGQLVAHLQSAFHVPMAVMPRHGKSGLSNSSAPLLPAGVATAFVRDGADRLVPQFGPSGPASSSSAPPAAMAMGTKASDAFELRDTASGLSVSVTLRDANDASVEVASGYLVYPAAYEGAADVLDRPYPSGTEQSLSFAGRLPIRLAPNLVVIGSAAKAFPSRVIAQV